MPVVMMMTKGEKKEIMILNMTRKTGNTTLVWLTRPRSRTLLVCLACLARCSFCLEGLVVIATRSWGV